jgi:DNA repair exonuclease SbcCD ATPase subunit
MTRRRILVLENQVKHLQAENDSLQKTHKKTAIQIAESTIRELEEQVRKLKAGNTALLGEQEGTARSTALILDYTETQKAFRRLGVENSQLQDQLQSAEKEYEKLRRLLHNSDTEVAKLTSQLQDAQAVIEDFRGSSSSRIPRKNTSSTITVVNGDPDRHFRNQSKERQDARRSHPVGEKSTTKSNGRFNREKNKGKSNVGDGSRYRSAGTAAATLTVMPEERKGGVSICPASLHHYEMTRG